MHTHIKCFIVYLHIPLVRHNFSECTPLIAVSIAHIFHIHRWCRGVFGALALRLSARFFSATGCFALAHIDAHHRHRYCHKHKHTHTAIRLSLPACLLLLCVVPTDSSVYENHLVETLQKWRTVKPFVSRLSASILYIIHIRQYAPLASYTK